MAWDSINHRYRWNETWQNIPTNWAVMKPPEGSKKWRKTLSNGSRNSFNHCAVLGAFAVIIMHQSLWINKLIGCEESFYQLFVKIREFLSGECLMFSLWFHGKWKTSSKDFSLLPFLLIQFSSWTRWINNFLHSFPQSFCEWTNRKLCLLFRFNWQTSRVKKDNCAGNRVQ